MNHQQHFDVVYAIITIVGLGLVIAGGICGKFTLLLSGVVVLWFLLKISDA